MEKSTLEGKVASELHQIASDLGIEGHKGLKKADLIERILSHANGASAPPRSVAPDATEERPAEPAGNGDTRVDAAEGAGNGDVRRPERPQAERSDRRDDRRETDRGFSGGPPRD
ncbi:MAG: Rho termination factor N-terminal domain-containing protein, partial [Actinomycetota bacterium]